MISKKTIADKISAKIPSHFNPVDFLQETLNISKESVYRRLKGEIAFTFEEIIVLSSELSFSLDEIAFGDEDKALNEYPISFQFRSNKMFNPQKTFADMLSAHIKGEERTNKAKKVEVLVATNRLMILTAARFNHLFKFYYYKWIHQTQQMPLNFGISDVVISDDIIALRNKLKTYKLAGEHIYILDRNFLKNTLSEVRYYYNRKLISEDEMILLQNDFYQFIDLMEYQVKNRIQMPGYANYIYLSTVPIDSAGLYCRTDDKKTLDLWISYGSSIHTEYPEMCKTYKSWFNSLKKYSSLITQCNEALQMDFFDRQRRYIKSITDKDYIYE